MSMVIRSNMSALRTYNLLNVNQSHAQKHMLKVSTGMKINSAQDDASAYSISERMRVRIRALDQAYQNTQNGSSMIKTAEGAVSNILETLRTLKEKAIDAANDSNTNEDRRIIQKEFNQLIDQVEDDTLVTFNGKYLINGSKNNALLTTRSIFFNGNLARDIVTSGENATSFSEMKNRNGESLGIKDTDTVAWSYVSSTDGTWHGKLTGADNFDDLRQSVEDVVGYDDINRIANSPASITTSSSWVNKFVKSVSYNQPGIIMESLLAPGSGIYAFSGFSLKVLDSEGNVNKYATAQLQFIELQRAEGKTGDRALSFQVGAQANQATKVALTDMGTRAIGLKYWWSEEPETGQCDPGFLSISTKDDANIAIDVLDRAVKRVLDEQSNIGSFLSRLEYTATNLTTSYTNDTASESVIRDADMATEMSGYVRYNVLTQSAQAMLAQANQNPLNVLALLSGET